MRDENAARYARFLLLTQALTSTSPFSKAGAGRFSLLDQRFSVRLRLFACRPPILMGGKPDPEMVTLRRRQRTVADRRDTPNSGRYENRTLLNQMGKVELSIRGERQCSTQSTGRRARGRGSGSGCASLGTAPGLCVDPCGAPGRRGALAAPSFAVRMALRQARFAPSHFPIRR